MAGKAIERLIEAIDYLERAPGGAASFVLQVDGGEIAATETDGKLRLVCRLTDDADATSASLPRLAEYAAGRIMREEATLAFGSLDVWTFGRLEGSPAPLSSKHPNAQTSQTCFLWREIPAGADAHTLRRAFEAFCDSCDWWRARLGADGGGGDAIAANEMRILP